MPEQKTRVSTVTPTVTPSRTLTHPHDLTQPSLTQPLTPLTLGEGLTPAYRERQLREGQSAPQSAAADTSTSTPRGLHTLHTLHPEIAACQP